MPSSLIFTGLVVLWLLILVPAVARRRQEVAHLSGASLGGRVLARPHRGGSASEEGSSVDDEGARTVGTRSPEVWLPRARAGGASKRGPVVPPPRRDDGPEPGDDLTSDPVDEAELTEAGLTEAGLTEAELTEGELTEAELTEADDEPPADDRLWERPPPRYRRGRGGFDPEADAESARRRYAFRQRMVLALLVTALLTGVAAAVAWPVVWWAHGAIDLILVAYLVHLRRQVREEAAIRERRASRLAGTHRPPAADDHELDDWAQRGREITRRPAPADVEDDEAPDAEFVDELSDELDEDGDADRVRGVGEPVGLLPARRRGADEDEPESALPRLSPAPPPPLPPGTSLVEVDDDDLDLHDLGAPGRPHRRAVGE